MRNLITQATGLARSPLVPYEFGERRTVRAAAGTQLFQFGRSFLMLPYYWSLAPRSQNYPRGTTPFEVVTGAPP